MPTQCFLIEHVEGTQRQDPCCDDLSHDPLTSWELRRTDTGAIVGRSNSPSGIASMPEMVGAMWWETVHDDSHKPTGPEDLPPLDHLNETQRSHLLEYWQDRRARGWPAAQPAFYFDRGVFEALVVRTPGGIWHIDSRASNCGSPYDYNHRCWVRHGDPPLITVDKQGATCSAGGGSIQCGTYHGFLQNGVLT